MDLLNSKIKSTDVKMPEMLIGYFIGPFGALLASGIFTSILQNYFTDVLKLDLTFLTTLQLVSTILIVGANLIVGQLIERTHCLAGKARPWILLSALTMSIGSVLMFIVPFEGLMKMIWVAIAYNLFYAVAYPIYNTANSTLIPLSTRNSKQRGGPGIIYQCSGFGCYGRRLYGISYSGVLCTERKSTPVVPHNVGSSHIQCIDNLSAVSVYQRKSYRRIYADTKGRQ